MKQVGVCWYVDSPAEWWALTPSWEGRTSVKETKSINFSLSLSGKGFGRSTQGPLRSLIRGRPSTFLCWKVWDRPQTGSLPWAASSKACGLGSVRWKIRASACVCTRWVFEYSFQKSSQYKSAIFDELLINNSKITSWFYFLVYWPLRCSLLHWHDWW